MTYFINQDDSCISDTREITKAVDRSHPNCIVCSSSLASCIVHHPSACAQSTPTSILRSTCSSLFSICKPSAHVCCLPLPLWTKNTGHAQNFPEQTFLGTLSAKQSLARCITPPSQGKAGVTSPSSQVRPSGYLLLSHAEVLFVPCVFFSLHVWRRV